jgi:hypothetical protein
MPSLVIYLLASASTPVRTEGARAEPSIDMEQRAMVLAARTEMEACGLVRYHPATSR